MQKFKFDKNNILVLIICLLSFGNILLQLKFHNYLSIIDSVIGICGVILFFLQKDIFRYFIWVWIFAQAIIIDQTIIDPSRHLFIKEPIFDLSQVFCIKFGFNSRGPDGSFGLNFNLLIIVYFFLFRTLKTTALINRSIGILILKGNHDISFDDSIYANLMQRVNLDSDDNWLLGQLSSIIYYNQKPVDRILVQTVDGELTGTFRIAYQEQTISEGINSTLNFERVDWIMIE
jgi:hypothetical protein